MSSNNSWKKKKKIKKLIAQWNCNYSDIHAVLIVLFEIVFEYFPIWQYLEDKIIQKEQLFYKKKGKEKERKIDKILYKISK